MEITEVRKLLAVSCWLLAISYQSLAVSFPETPSFEIKVLYSDGVKTIIQLDILETPIVKTHIMGKLYHKIHIHGEGTISDIGKPELPGIFRLVGIPDGASCEVSVLEKDVDTLKGYRIYPFQKPTTDDSKETEFVIDKKFYESNAIYPTCPVQVEKPVIWRDITIATLRFYPFAHNPVDSTLIVYRHLVIQLFSRGGSRSVPTKKASPTYLRMYKSAILNPASLNIVENSKESDSLKYLVIACDSFIQGISPLIDWHHKRGIETKIVSTCSTGTTPDSIKSYITEQYTQYGIEYVLFVGDVEHIPLYDWDGYPSQYWYACITGDGVPDLYPELVVSRFSVKDTVELSHQVSKTLNYLKNPPLDEWLTRSILCAHCETIPDNYASFKEEVRTYSYSFFTPTFDTAYGRSNGTTAQVLSAINEGRNIVNYRGHGSKSLWASWDCNGNPLFDLDVLSLTNTLKPAIVLNMCCYTGDIEYPVYCLAETWMRASGGAVATYGATRTTYTEPHNIFDKHFYKAFGDTLPGLFCVGDIVYFAYSQTLPYGSTAEVNAKQCILLGDPLIEVGTGIPETLEVNHDSIITLKDSNIVVTVTSGGNSVSKALVCVMKDHEIHTHGFTDNAGGITLPVSPTTAGTLWVTVTAHSYLPYEGYTIIESAGISMDTDIIKESFQISPNPAKKFTVISYQLPELPNFSTPQLLTLAIHDISGRLVRSLAITEHRTPITEIVWDGSNSRGEKVSSGVYLFLFKTDKLKIVRKGVFIK